jgi:hypothetical protein
VSRAATLRRRVRAEAPFLAVLLVMVIGLGSLAIAPGHWRRGSGVLALALLLAGVLRLALSPARAGLLTVRARWLDALCYLGLGVAILVVDIRLRH